MSKYKFSLIMATYGRKEEVDSFLKSIKNIDYDLSKIQIIIVDQNDSINLSPIINSYKDELIIEYVKSHKKGLSINRNIGLKLAEGQIVAFPDDDCEYLPSTLEEVEKNFRDTNVHVVMGRIVERDGSDSLRIWPKEELKINKINFYTKCSSITIFVKSINNSILFNEKLGAGTFFGSCEDSDVLYSQLKNNRNIMYFPDIKIYHPHYDSNNNMDISKVQSYGLGFGGFVKSNLDIFLIYLFLKSIAYHFVKTIIGILTFRKEKIIKSGKAFLSRFKGLVMYKNE